MSSRQQALLVIFGVLVILVGGGGLLVWPGYQEVRQTRARIADLHAKIEGLSGQAEEVARLAEELAAKQDRVRYELREIPTVPDIASLMRRLSFPIDGGQVLDQTFTAGSANDILPHDETSDAKGMPLTVDMRATFDSIFALIQAAESMDRLVRITSVQLVCDREAKTKDEHPVIAATVGLEAIYGVGPAREGS